MTIKHRRCIIDIVIHGGERGDIEIMDHELEKDLKIKI
jgi:hypothetical protein